MNNKQDRCANEQNEKRYFAVIRKNGENQTQQSGPDDSKQKLRDKLLLHRTIKRF